MSELPAEVWDRAARAAFDAHEEVIGFNEGRDLDRDFKVQIVGWLAVVDAVTEVIAEHWEVGPVKSSATVVNELRAKAAHQAGTTGLMPFARLDKARQEYWRGLAEVSISTGSRIAELEASRDKMEWATHEILKRRGEVDAERDALSTMLRRMARRVGEQRKSRDHFAQVFGEGQKNTNEWHRRNRIELTDRAEKAEAAGRELDRKLVKQRKRRKAAEAKVAEQARTLNESMGGLRNCNQAYAKVIAERDALKDRIGNLRVALEYYRGFPTNSVVASKALAADFAAGQAEEKT